MPVVHDDDEADDVHVPSQHDEQSVKNRYSGGLLTMFLIELKEIWNFSNEIL